MSDPSASPMEDGMLDDNMSDSSLDSVELLTKSILRRGLSDIHRSSDGKNFAFTRLDLAGQNIKNLEGDLATYPELRYLNLSNNEILDLAPLAALPSLLSLNAAQNHIHHIDSFFASPHPSLQLLQLDQNEIEYVLANTIGGGGKKTKASLSTNFPNLTALTLSNNKITSFLRMEDSLHDFTAHSKLTILDLSFNNLTSLDGLSLLPSLKVLNLASNALERLEGIQSLKSLEKLNVSENKLQSLFVELNRLATLPALASLIITQGNSAFVEELEQAAATYANNNPDAVQPPIDMMSEILILLPRLNLLDGRKVTSVQRRTADMLKKERLAEAERQEEAKRLLAEEEAAEAKRQKEQEEEEEKDKEKDDEEDDEDEEKDGDDEKHSDADHEADGDIDGPDQDDGERESGLESAPTDDNQTDGMEDGGFAGDEAGQEDGQGGNEAEDDGGDEEEDE